MGTPPEAVESRRNLSGAQVAAVLGGLLLVLVLLWFFFLRGDGDSADTGTTTPPPSGQPAPEPSPSPSPAQPGKGPVETFDVFTPKDPFDPLVTASSGGGTGGGTTDGGTTPPPSDGNGGTPNGDNTPGGGGSTIGGHRVRVNSVFTEGGEPRAQVQVDGTVYTVSEGEQFADNFEVLSISGDCVTMLFGDDEFTLCEGQEILK